MVYVCTHMHTLAHTDECQMSAILKKLSSCLQADNINFRIRQERLPSRHVTSSSMWHNVMLALSDPKPSLSWTFCDPHVMTHSPLNFSMGMHIKKIKKSYIHIFICLVHWCHFNSIGYIVTQVCLSVEILCPLSFGGGLNRLHVRVMVTLHIHLMVTNFIFSDGCSICHRRHDTVCNVCKWHLHYCHRLLFVFPKCHCNKRGLSPVLTSFTHQHQLCRSARWRI